MNANISAVNRIMQIHPAFSQSQEFLQKILDHKATHFLLCVSGPSGFGRTLWAKSIWDLNKDELPGSFWQVNLAKRQENPLPVLLIQMIDDLYNRLPRSYGDEITHYPENDNVDNLINQVIALIGKFKFTMLVIDDFDDLNPEQAEFLSEQLFKPLVQTQKVAILLTSETIQRFENNYLLYDSQFNLELSAFDLIQVQTAFPEYTDWGYEIYKITGGLVTLLDAFIQILKQEGISPSDHLNIPDEIVRRFYNQFFGPIIFEENQITELRHQILILSLLRRFDIKVLPRLMLAISPEEYGNFGMEESLKLIAALKGRVYWRKQGGYSLGKPMRLALSEFVFHENKELFINLHTTIRNEYWKLINESYREADLLEFLYHSSQLLKFRDQMEDQEIQSRLSEELLDFIDGEKGPSLKGEEFDSLRRTLPNDKELAPFISESVLVYIAGQTNTSALEEKLFSAQMNESKQKKSPSENN